VTPPPTAPQLHTYVPASSPALPPQPLPPLSGVRYDAGGGGGGGGGGGARILVPGLDRAAAAGGGGGGRGPGPRQWPGPGAELDAWEEGGLAAHWQPRGAAPGGGDGGPDIRRAGLRMPVAQDGTLLRGVAGVAGGSVHPPLADEEVLAHTHTHTPLALYIYI
jgi:hypothetical protein